MFKEGYDASSQPTDAETAVESNDLSSQLQADRIQARLEVTKPAITALATDAGAHAARNDYLDLGSVFKPTIEAGIKLGEQTTATNPFASSYEAPNVFRKPLQTARNYYEA